MWTPDPYQTEGPWPTASIPPVLTGLKQVSTAQYEAGKTPAAPYDWSATSNGAKVSYNVSGRKGSVPLPLSTTELAATANNLDSLIWSASRMVFYAAQPIGSCRNCGAWPSTWRILSAPIGQDGIPGAFAELATGQSTRLLTGPEAYICGMGGCSDGGYIDSPRVALDGDRIAYTLEIEGGYRILMRSLVDGSTLRQIDSASPIDRLALANGTLVWMAFSGEETRTLPLRISTEVQPTARDLMVFQIPSDQDSWAVPAWILQGSILAWDGYSTGKIWTQDVVNGSPVQISPSGAFCRLRGFDGSRALMSCASTWWDWEYSGYGDFEIWSVYWSRAGGFRLLPDLDPSGRWPVFGRDALAVEAWDGEDTTPCVIPYSVLDR